MKRCLWLILFGVVVLMLQPTLVAQELEEEEEILDIVSGKVATIDLEGNKLSIIDMEGETQEFVLEPDLTTVWDDTSDEEKELSDLTVGKEVVVEFRASEGGEKLASWIDILQAEEETLPPEGE